MKQCTADEFRKNTSEFGEYLIRSGEPLVIMKNRRPQFVVLDYLKANELGLVPSAAELQDEAV